MAADARWRAERTDPAATHAACGLDAADGRVRRDPSSIPQPIFMEGDTGEKVQKGGGVFSRFAHAPVFATIFINSRRKHCLRGVVCYSCKLVML
eukprot:scaffold60712_cov49-Phaeocystis_antarctica.AAC.2